MPTAPVARRIRKRGQCSLKARMLEFPVRLRREYLWRPKVAQRVPVSSVSAVRSGQRETLPLYLPDQGARLGFSPQSSTMAHKLQASVNFNHLSSTGASFQIFEGTRQIFLSLKPHARLSARCAGMASSCLQAAILFHLGPSLRSGFIHI